MDPAFVSLPYFFLCFFLVFLFLIQTGICLFSLEKVRGAGLVKTLVQTSVLLWLDCRNLCLVPCAGDLGCVICTREPAERFIFFSRCSDLFNLLLCPFPVPTLSSFQSQSSCLLSTRYPYKGLCAFLNSGVIAVFTVYLLSVQITFFFP